jgi:hypothetical protein
MKAYRVAEYSLLAQEVNADEWLASNTGRMGKSPVLVG